MIDEVKARSRQARSSAAALLSSETGDIKLGRRVEALEQEVRALRREVGSLVEYLEGSRADS